MPTSVRLSSTTERLLNRAARSQGTSKTAIIDAALKEYCPRVLSQAQERPIDRIRDLIGAGDIDDPRLSENTGRRFREMLEARRHDRG